MKYLHINRKKSPNQMLQFNTLCMMMQYFVIMRFIFPYYRHMYVYIYIFENLGIRPTNRKCTIFCPQVFPVLKKQ